MTVRIRLEVLGREQCRVEGRQTGQQRQYLVEGALRSGVDARLRPGQRPHIGLHRVAALLPGPFGVALHLAQLEGTGQSGLEAADVGARPPAEDVPDDLADDLAVIAGSPPSAAGGRGRRPDGADLLGEHRVRGQVGEGLALAREVGLDLNVLVGAGVDLDPLPDGDVPTLRELRQEILARILEAKDELALIVGDGGAELRLPGVVDDDHGAGHRAALLVERTPEDRVLVQELDDVLLWCQPCGLVLGGRLERYDSEREPLVRHADGQADAGANVLVEFPVVGGDVKRGSVARDQERDVLCDLLAILGLDPAADRGLGEQEGDRDLCVNAMRKVYVRRGRGKREIPARRPGRWQNADPVCALGQGWERDLRVALLKLLRRHGAPVEFEGDRGAFQGGEPGGLGDDRLDREQDFRRVADLNRLGILGLAHPGREAALRRHNARPGPGYGAAPEPEGPAAERRYRVDVALPVRDKTAEDAAIVGEDLHGGIGHDT